MPRLPTLLPADPSTPFPPVGQALRDPDGLLAVGGDLGPERLLDAYRRGIFPWFGPGQPVMWWSPDPRAVFRTADFRLASRLRRDLRRSHWRLTADTSFDHVIDACATVPRRDQQGTWITPSMRSAYRRLHRLGHAHSVEVRDGDRLVGGIYGVAIGHMFFGESMFSLEPGGSKVALGGLVHRMREWGWPLLDAQVGNPHLLQLGAIAVPRPDFIAEVERLCSLPGPPGPWTERFGAWPASELAASARRPRTEA